MTRNPKMLGLALVAVCAFSAVAAQGASATTHKFVCTKSSCDITGEQTLTEGVGHVLKLGEAELRCTTVHFTGKQAGEEAESITLSPKYEGCKLGSTEVEFKNEGCTYKFTGETTKATPTEKEVATVHLECEAGKFIKIIGAGCTIDISSQTDHGATYVNTGSEPTDLTVTLHTFSTNYNSTNLACGLVGIPKGEHSDATVRGDITVKAYETGHAGDPNFQVGLHAFPGE